MTLGLRTAIQEREKRRVRTPVNGLGSRARPEGESKRPLRSKAALWATALWAALLGASLLTVACKPGASADEAAGGSAASRRRTPSGLPVPRYVSLKFGEVNARGGPGDDYKLLWTYRARGLPLQVIAETADWRRVCDPEGAMAWVHQRTVDTRRTVMRTRAEALDMRRAPQADAAVAARLAGSSVAVLDQCREGWCKISVGRTQGWIPAGEVWGTAPAAQCRPSLPVVRR
jgi:SH3-like domain-containing protein